MNHVYFITFLALIYLSLALDQDVVQTKYGAVRGNVFHDPPYRWFQGVPFAAPPLGDLRWENPQAPGSWDGVLDCTNFSVGCAQNAHSLDVPKNTSEDCLYLDVYTPLNINSSSLVPVMMWFYGGDFKEGGDIILYDGQFSSSHSNTIVVVPNYRVGNLGFLKTKHLPGNVGLEDQRFALKWIQDNIKSFGGDPGRVTLFGESAGGQSVLLHLSAPEASKGLFHAAIAESGSLAISYRNVPEALELGYNFATWLGCSIGDTKCLKSKTTREVLEAAHHAQEIPLNLSMAIMPWGPTMVGNDQVPMQPIDAFTKGKVYPVPLMMGSNLNEGVLFAYAISPHAPLNAIEYGGILTGIFLEDADKVIMEYPPVGGDNRMQLADVLTDYLMACASRHALDLVANVMPARFLYQFVHKWSVDPWPPHQQYCAHMCCHGAEIPGVFHFTGVDDGAPWNFTKEEDDLSTAMNEYWTNLGKLGHPGTPSNSDVQWSEYQGPSGPRLSVNLNWPGLAMVKDLKKDKCDFWDAIDYRH